MQFPRWVKSLLTVRCAGPRWRRLLMLVAWELAVRLTNTPPYLLPGPFLMLQTLLQDWPNCCPPGSSP
jgi:NitT/TauT family transport system permease protein